MGLEEEFGASVKAFANISLKIGEQADEMKSYLKRLNEVTPVLRRVANSGIYHAATGYLRIGLGRPDKGTYWDVESLLVGGQEVNTTAAGMAGLYVISGNAGVSPTLSNAVDIASSLPNSAFYGFRDIVLNDAEDLVLYIWNGTDTQIYVASVSVSVYPVREGAGRSVSLASE